MAYIIFLPDGEIIHAELATKGMTSSAYVYADGKDGYTRTSWHIWINSTWLEIDPSEVPPQYRLHILLTH